MENNKIDNCPWKKNFFTIVIGQTVSLIGSSAVQFSVIWWLASETSSPLIMALSGLVAFLPQMILGPFAGVWIDRMKRKTVMICADLFMGLVAAVFALMFLSGQPPYWVACVVLAMRGLGNVFHTPASQAIIPLLVPSSKLVKANGWSQFMQSGAFMLGPVLGAAMYAVLPLPIILLSDLVGAAAAVATVVAVKIPEIPAQDKEASHFWNEMKYGMRILYQDRKIFVVIIAGAATMLFFMPLSSFYPLMTSNYFGGTPWHASMVELAFALGMMISAAVIASINIKNKMRGIHIGLLIVGLSTLICGVLPRNIVWFLPFVILCAIMGAGANIYNIIYFASLQENLPREALGRVFSLIATLMSFTMPLGLLVAGPIAERYGVAVWFFISGVAMIIIAVVSTLVTTAIRQPKESSATLSTED